jgi:hypothetical protein
MVLLQKDSLEEQCRVLPDARAVTALISKEDLQV